jgi:hypothetical protein
VREVDENCCIGRTVLHTDLIKKQRHCQEPVAGYLTFKADQTRYYLCYGHAKFVQRRASSVTVTWLQ